MRIEQVEELLALQDERRSYMYPILKERLEDYPEHEIPFAEEFLFSEDRYLAIKKHMVENDILKDVVDIGCQMGFQSEIFLDCDSYVGVDCLKPSRFFNDDQENVRYVHGMFPNIEVDVTGKTVISCMSLGYFNNFFKEQELEAGTILAEALRDANTVYITSTLRFIKQVAEYFDGMEKIIQSETGDFNTYVLTRKGVL